MSAYDEGEKLKEAGCVAWSAEKRRAQPEKKLFNFWEKLFNFLKKLNNFFRKDWLDHGGRTGSFTRKDRLDHKKGRASRRMGKRVLFSVVRSLDGGAWRSYS